MQFHVVTQGDTPEITIVVGERRIETSSVRFEGETLRFNFSMGPPFECAVAPQPDGSFGGDCEAPLGSETAIAKLVMIPPGAQAMPQATETPNPPADPPSNSLPAGGMIVVGPGSHVASQFLSYDTDDWEPSLAIGGDDSVHIVASRILASNASSDPEGRGVIWSPGMEERALLPQSCRPGINSLWMD